MSLNNNNISTQPLADLAAIGPTDYLLYVDRAVGGLPASGQRE